MAEPLIQFEDCTFDHVRCLNCRLRVVRGSEASHHCRGPGRVDLSFTSLPPLDLPGDET